MPVIGNILQCYCGEREEANQHDEYAGGNVLDPVIQLIDETMLLGHLPT